MSIRKSGEQYPVARDARETGFVLHRNGLPERLWLKLASKINCDGAHQCSYEALKQTRTDGIPNKEWLERAKQYCRERGYDLKKSARVLRREARVSEGLSP